MEGQRLHNVRKTTKFGENGAIFPLIFCLPLTGCVVEEIDSIIAARGVTECSSSTGDTSGEAAAASTDLSTNSSSDTSSGEGNSESSTSENETLSEGSASGSSSTGQETPVCGDGVLEGDETCDDGNLTPGDGCQECAKDSIVFITSEAYQGFALGGLYGADQRCRSLAAKAGLERPLTFKAWLSTPAMSASERLLHSRGRYVLVNGLVVAQNWDALTSGALENPIMVDEQSITQETLVWTGTLADGQPALGSEFCEDWDDDSGLLKLGGIGASASTDATWTFFEHSGCGSEINLYCVEQ